MAKNNSKVTPLMKQYFELKAQHPDALLLFRVGDFYETFGEDAITTSRLLGIVLTSRNNGGSKIELAGFPYHSLDLYLPRLVKSGQRIAICEQLEKPSKDKKIVKRGVTEIVTPGVSTSDSVLDVKTNNYLASVHQSDHGDIGIALIDLSTGEFICTQTRIEQIQKFLMSLQPTEILCEKGQKEFWISNFENFNWYPIDDWIFEKDYSYECLLNHFKTNSLKGYGIEDLHLAQISAGSILHYLNSTRNTSLDHVHRISQIKLADYVWLDQYSIRNLELISSLHPSGKSLFDVLDYTKTPMGSRLLKKWILFPLIDIKKINKRLDLITKIISNEAQVEPLSNLLIQIGDFERLIGKIAMFKGNPKTFAELKSVLQIIPEINNMSQEIFSNKDLYMDTAVEVQTILNSRLSDDPPALITKGNVIRQGYNNQLDHYRNLIFNSKKHLNELLVKQIENTGISNLKIGFNNVFGYYFEVTNKYKNHDYIPEEWTRKQTLTNSERYTSSALKKLENEILEAESKILELEQELFDQMIQDIIPFIPTLKENAQKLSTIDCLLSLANVSIRNNYNRPQLDDGYAIEIKNGRHPVIEQHLKLTEDYIPNDILLENNVQQILMITGPNMSGKSAILRQTALICLMAQMGSYVPAEEVNLGIIDRIFTRVGASDNISGGESTFMVEMNETSNILNNLSKRSLILMDEIGRGTSTYDGISIAWSIVEYLHQHSAERPKTLFATHYHELNELSQKFDRVKNYNVSVKELKNKIVFLRSLKPGGSNQSFGIHVAQMSGMPQIIISRANQILKQLQSKHLLENNAQILNKLPFKENKSAEVINVHFEHLIDMIENIDINTMTPIECMMKLKEIVEIVEVDITQ